MCVALADYATRAFLFLVLMHTCKAPHQQAWARPLPEAIMLSWRAMLSHKHDAQGDRWEEGNDPELFNLRRKTSRDEAPRCAQPPMQRTSSSRGPPAPGSAAPQGDLPPHLLAQHPSGKVPVHSPPSGEISRSAEQLLCTASECVPNGCGNAGSFLGRRCLQGHCSADSKSGAKQDFQDGHCNSRILHRIALPCWQVSQQ